jgi:hypothetical protein
MKKPIEILFLLTLMLPSLITSKTKLHSMMISEQDAQMIGGIKPKPGKSLKNGDRWDCQGLSQVDKFYSQRTTWCDLQEECLNVSGGVRSLVGVSPAGLFKFKFSANMKGLQILFSENDKFEPYIYKMVIDGSKLSLFQSVKFVHVENEELFFYQDELIAEFVHHIATPDTVHDIMLSLTGSKAEAKLYIDDQYAWTVKINGLKKFKFIGFSKTIDSQGDKVCGYKAQSAIEDLISLNTSYTKR